MSFTNEKQQSSASHRGSWPPHPINSYSTSLFHKIISLIFMKAINLHTHLIIRRLYAYLARLRLDCVETDSFNTIGIFSIYWILNIYNQKLKSHDRIFIVKFNNCLPTQQGKTASCFLKT